MNLLIKRRNSIKSSDYYELLNTISEYKLVENSGSKVPIKTKYGIILNPDYRNPDYEKAETEKIYITSATIRFSKDGKLFIVKGCSHKDCFSRAKQFFKDLSDDFERGFITNTLEHINSYDARSVIKNYKFNNDHSLKFSHYNIKKIDNHIHFFNEENVFIGKSIILNEISKFGTLVYVVNMNPDIYKDDIKVQKEKIWYIHINLDKNLFIFSEKSKEFKFAKKQRIHCQIIKRFE